MLGDGSGDSTDFRMVTGAALYLNLKSENQALGADLYEGLVAKRTNSPYPVQQRSASEETTFWVKHRWAF